MHLWDKHRPTAIVLLSNRYPGSGAASLEAAQDAYDTAYDPGREWEACITNQLA